MRQLKEFIKNKMVNNILFSVLGTIGIIKLFEITTTANLSNNLVNLIIFILLFNIYKIIDQHQKSERIFSYCFSIFLSLILVIGAQLDVHGEIFWTLGTLIKIICLHFAIVPIIMYSTSYLKKINIKENLNYTRKLKLLTFSIIFLFNFLVFLALYPGIYGYDAGFQILQVLDSNVQLTSHFSLFFSFIIALCINLGKLLFNNYQIGFAIYTLLQMIFMTYVATRISLYVCKKTHNKLLFILCLIFYSLFPLYTAMVMSTAQDVIFSGLFALVILNLIELVNDDDYYKNKLNFLKLIILIFLLCIARNNGYYATIATIPFILLFKKNKKFLTILIFITPLILYKIYTGPIYNLINVQNESSIREISSIPSQQLARVYNYNYAVLDKKDLKLYNKFYTNLDDFKNYKFRQSIADPIKNVLNVDETDKNKGKYLSFWMRVGIKDIENYTEALLLNNLGVWYPNKEYNDTRMYHPYIEYNMLDAKKWNKNYIEIKRNSKFPIYEKVLNIIIEKNKWKKIPIISSFFEMGTYFLIFIYTIGICIVRKQKKYFIPLACIAGLYATVLAAPVALFRYCFPIVILMPVLATIIIEKKRN